MNAFRGRTCEELIHAFNEAGWDRSIGVIVPRPAPATAPSAPAATRSAHDGSYDGRGTIGLPVEELQGVIRDAPKPVIARVQGYAIGGGNVLATILRPRPSASEKAQFGQVGPKVGSVDPGYRHRLSRARVVGEKKAREIWYLCRRYSGQPKPSPWAWPTCVVPHDQLDAEVARVRRDHLRAQPHRASPSPSAASTPTRAQSSPASRGMGMQALELYYDIRGVTRGRAGLQ
jgi:2-ketocyclohexanecarboxyl-CoA hydrolase